MPGHAVGQVSAAQGVCDQRRLLRRGIGDEDADLALGCIRDRDQGTVRRVPERPRRGLLRLRRDSRGCRTGGHREAAGHPPGRSQQTGAAAAAGAQRDHGRRVTVRGAELLGEARQRPHVRAAERVNRLVRVAHGDQVPAIACQGQQQGLLRRVTVLVLIDEDGVVGVALALSRRATRQQCGGNADDLGVVVGGHWREVEPGRVPVKELPRRCPVVALGGPAEAAQRLAVQAALSGPHQHVAELFGESPGGQRGP